MVGPDFSQPGQPILQPDYVAKQHFPAANVMELSQWWQAFEDPKLNAILDRAQTQNLSLRESFERIAEARANVCLQGGQLKPNGNLISEYSYRKNSQNARPFVAENGDAFNLFTLGVDASWELDLFGRIKRSIEAADAELKFQENDYQYIRQTLFADIVSSYLNIRLLQSQVKLIEQSLSIQNDTASLVSERMKAGVSTELDRSQTEAFQHRSKALLASVRQQVEIEFNRLGLLMGQAPDSTLRNFVGMLPLPAIPAVPNVGLPAELLRRRPDVLREEMAVKAASARIGIAEADLYPQLSLLGTIAVSSKNISGLFETNGLDFTVGPSFKWNILHYGRINNNIEIQQAQFRQTLASYQDTVLIAVRDVEDALVNHQGYLEQWNAFNMAITADQRAVTLSLERYRAGKANFQRVLDAQQQLLNDQRQSYEAQAQAITQLVRLYKAAGGGWELKGGYSNAGVYSAPSADPIISTMEMQPMSTPINMQPTGMQPSDFGSQMQQAPTQSSPIGQPFEQPMSNPSGDGETYDFLFPDQPGAAVPPQSRPVFQAPVQSVGFGRYPLNGEMPSGLQSQQLAPALQGPQEASVFEDIIIDLPTSGAPAFDQTTAGSL